MDRKTIKSAVRKKYAEIAKTGPSSQGCGCSASGSCCPSAKKGNARLVDYGEAAADVVAGADLGLGCGIPTLYAGIGAGDVVLDLGSGAGVDAFLAARAVGPEGRVIGVDMTPEMIERAQKNAKKEGCENVEFRLGDIEALPVRDESVDVVISNCVINLAPDKRRVYAEIRRVLRRGGRFSISDMVTYGAVPEKIRRDMEQWAGCVAGALDRDDYLKLVDEAGFRNVNIKDFVEYDYYKGDGFGLASITLEGLKP